MCLIIRYDHGHRPIQSNKKQRWYHHSPSGPQGDVLPNNREQTPCSGPAPRTWPTRFAFLDRAVQPKSSQPNFRVSNLESRVPSTKQHCPTFFNTTHCSYRLHIGRERKVKEKTGLLASIRRGGERMQSGLYKAAHEYYTAVCVA